jgi:hypothetical protein
MMVVDFILVLLILSSLAVGEICEGVTEAQQEIFSSELDKFRANAEQDVRNGIGKQAHKNSKYINQGCQK